jgi:hypothetical protein
MAKLKTAKPGDLFVDDEGDIFLVYKEHSKENNYNGKLSVMWLDTREGTWYTNETPFKDVSRTYTFVGNLDSKKLREIANEGR